MWTGQYVQCPVTNHDGKEYEKEDIYARLSYSALQQLERMKSTISAYHISTPILFADLRRLHFIRSWEFFIANDVREKL